MKLGGGAKGLNPEFIWLGGFFHQLDYANTPIDTIPNYTFANIFKALIRLV